MLMKDTNIKRTVKLHDITTKIGSGATPRGGKESYKNNGISLIRSLNVYDFKFEYDDLAHINDVQANELSNVEVRSNDILLNITGASVARCCMVPQQILPARVNQHVAIVRINPSLANPQYILYVINSPQYKKHFLALAQGGATREALTKEAISNFEVQLPPLPIQRTIASILSAYDDLIENNTRRIAILEEMARLLYEEWFVKFRFPGHEQVKMVQSELGMIPEGWEVVRFFDIAEIMSGGTPKTTDPAYWGGDIPFYTPKDAPDSFFVTTTEKSITENGLKACSSNLYPKNTVFITARGTVGRVALNAVEMAMNQSCYAIKGREKIDQFFVFMHLKNCIRHLKQTANGAVFETIIVDTFKWLQVIKPPLMLIDTFSAIIRPMFNQIEKLTYKNANLRRTRDLLLPKLISGEIDVSSWAEGDAEEIARELAAVGTMDAYSSGAGTTRKVAEAGPVEPIDDGTLERPSLWE